MNGYNFYRDNDKPPVKRGLLSYLIVGIIGAVIGGVLVLTFAPEVLLERVVSEDTALEDNREPENEEVILPVKTEGQIFTSAVRKVMPAVVGIHTIKFKEDMLPEKSGIKKTGSGVIIDTRGYILTNYQDADSKASKITVYLAGNRRITAAVVWTDQELDLSILKIDAEELTAAELGNPDTVEVGELAVAIGNPTGQSFQSSAAAGIISALNRVIPLDKDKFMENLIQTDASINEDNSGGPLINSEGKIIGINTIKATSAEGMGFAIPVNIVVPVIKSLVETGSFKPPYIGFTGHIEDIAGGFCITNIDKSSEAYNAGIREDDIILEINDIEVNTLSMLKRVIYGAGPGSSIRIKYKESLGDIKNITIKLEETQ